MNYGIFAIMLSVGLCVGMLCLFEVGRRLGGRRLAQDPEGARTGLGSIEASVFALLGLLLAFTVTGAGARFDLRRDLIVEETNNIGTAYLRLDVLSAGAQPALRESFRHYLDVRIETYRKPANTASAKQDLATATQLQQKIWRQAVTALQAKDVVPQATGVLLPALNAMIDITTTRYMATQRHLPTIIFVMLFGLALASALLSGYGMAGKTRSWLHMLSFAVVISIAVYIIIDLEYPRLGFIRVDDFDQALVDLRKQMDE